MIFPVGFIGKGRTASRRNRKSRDGRRLMFTSNKNKTICRRANIVAVVLGKKRKFSNSSFAKVVELGGIRKCMEK